MKIPIYQVDAFTSSVFGGNPAAVCPLDEWLDENLMQKIGMENNLSETAFFVKNDEAYDIRWFTPLTEVDLCGHATLASAFVIFNFLKPHLNEITFHTKSRGNLKVFRSGEKITLDFPSTPPVPAIIKREISEGLGRLPMGMFKSRDLMAVYESEEMILNLDPNFEILKKIDCHAFIVTAPGDNSDFVSRFFAPSVGINEDPVTGSAHTMLIPYWSERLGKSDLHAIQVSKRKGELFCSNKGERVHISGNAALYMKGEIELDF
jgi:PhzF family phenazine biosynthesis protein